MVIKKYNIAIILVCISFWGFCQDTTLAKNALSPYVNLHYGFVMPSAKSVEYLGQSHIQAIELGLEIKTRGAKYWHKAYNYPTFGITALAFNLNNPTLGNFFVLVPYQTLNLIKPTNFELKFRIGAGIGYISNKFNKENNHRNRVLSADLGAVMHGGIEANYLIGKKGKLSAKLFFTHMSNGGYSMPNFGINLPTISVGYSYFLNNREIDYGINHEIPKFKKLTYDFSFSIGVKENYPTNGEKYNVFKISAYGIYRQSYKTGWVVGFDGFNDLSLKGIQERDNLERKDVKRIGLITGHELHVGRFSLVTLLGTYCYKPFKRDGLFYQRYGFKYYFNPKIYAGVMLKTHLGVADNIEWNLGIRL